MRRWIVTILRSLAHRLDPPDPLDGQIPRLEPYGLRYECEPDCSSFRRDDMTGENLGMGCDCDGPLVEVVDTTLDASRQP
jgi:hypothetical protein